MRVAPHTPGRTESKVGDPVTATGPVGPGAAITSVLAVELLSSGTTGTLILSGVLGATSIAALEAQVDQLGCLPCRQVVLDMRAVTALEAIGANVILGLYHYVVARGGELRAIVPPGPVAELLDSVAEGLVPLTLV
jgi:anti-anti-sigma regulatory factor